MYCNREDIVFKMASAYESAVINPAKSSSKDDDDDEELAALRLAALLSRKSAGAKKQELNPPSNVTLQASYISTQTGPHRNFWPNRRGSPRKSVPNRGGPCRGVPNRGVPRRGVPRRGTPIQNLRSNLIVINPVTLNDDEENKTGFEQKGSVPRLVLPQDKWCHSGTEDSLSPKTGGFKKKDAGRFSRFESDSDSSDSDYDVNNPTSSDGENTSQLDHFISNENLLPGEVESEENEQESYLEVSVSSPEQRTVHCNLQSDESTAQELKELSSHPGQNQGPLTKVVSSCIHSESEISDSETNNSFKSDIPQLVQNVDGCKHIAIETGIHKDNSESVMSIECPPEDEQIKDNLKKNIKAKLEGNKDNSVPKETKRPLVFSNKLEARRIKFEITPPVKIQRKQILLKDTLGENSENVNTFKDHNGYISLISKNINDNLEKLTSNVGHTNRIGEQILSQNDLRLELKKRKGHKKSHISELKGKMQKNASKRNRHIRCSSTSSSRSRSSNSSGSESRNSSSDSSVKSSSPSSNRSYSPAMKSILSVVKPVSLLKSDCQSNVKDIANSRHSKQYCKNKRKKHSKSKMNKFKFSDLAVDKQFRSLPQSSKGIRSSSPDSEKESNKKHRHSTLKVSLSDCAGSSDSVSDSWGKKRLPVHMRLGMPTKKRVIEMASEEPLVNASCKESSIEIKPKKANLRVVTEISQEMSDKELETDSSKQKAKNWISQHHKDISWRKKKKLKW